MGAAALCRIFSLLNGGVSQADLATAVCLFSLYSCCGRVAAPYDATPTTYLTAFLIPCLFLCRLQAPVTAFYRYDISPARTDTAGWMNGPVLLFHVLVTLAFAPQLPVNIAYFLTMQ